MIYLTRSKQLLKIALIFGVFLLWGCSDKKSDDKVVVTDKVEATYSSLWDNAFSDCSVACHSPSATNGTEDGPDLSSKTLFYANTIGKTIAVDYLAWIRTGNCDTVSLISTGDANQSLVLGSLVQSVSDSISATFMCTSAFNLHEVEKVTLSDQATIDALTQWINDGALDNQ